MHAFVEWLTQGLSLIEFGPSNCRTANSANTIRQGLTVIRHGLHAPQSGHAARGRDWPAGYRKLWSDEAGVQTIIRIGQD